VRHETSLVRREAATPRRKATGQPHVPCAHVAHACGQSVFDWQPHEPPMHARPLPHVNCVQSSHLPPLPPHAAAASPGWQRVPSQQPPWQMPDGWQLVEHWWPSHA
jgi:hypothetical protein